MPQTKEQKRISYYKNREDILAKQREYNAKNKEAIATRRKLYYARTREELLDKIKAYAREHKEEIAIWQKKYREEHYEELKAYQKSYYEENKVLKGRYLSIDENIFDTIDTPEKAYWLGVMYTDGCVTGKKSYLSFVSKDEEWVQQFAEFLSAKHAVHKRTQGRSTTWSIRIGSQKLCSALINLGIVPRKTYNHDVPLYIPNGDLESHFWRGCIDGDGCIGFYPDRECIYLVLCNNNRILLEKAQVFFDGLGGIYTKKNNHYQWAYSLRHTKPICLLLDKLYQGSTVACRLKRKYNIYLEVKEESRF